MSLLKHHTDPETRSGLPAEFRPLLPWPWFDDLFRDADGRGLISVEEFTTDTEFVVRAELPGIDPDRDVNITVQDGTLSITAERRQEESAEEKGYVRRELRYGSFSRLVALPHDIDASAVKASYTDGILEVRAPLPPEQTESGEGAHKVPVNRA